MYDVKAFVCDEEKRESLFLVLSGLSLVLSFFHVFDLPFDIAWIAILLCGVPIVKGAVIGLVTEFDIKADVLVSLALIAAVGIGEIFAAGEVAFIMAIGAMLEERTVAKARAGIEKLVHLSPRTARVIRDGVESVVPAEQVVTGDIVRVFAGEGIAVDGVLVAGETSVDQSIITGEPMPVDKQPGDDVFSGTVNQFGSFDMRATRVGEDSSLQRMIRLVQSADAGKAKIVRMADRWATWIVVIALTAAVLTWWVTGELIRSVTILVVFCPCALVLATPTAIMAGIGNAARHGILVKEGDALERLAPVRRIAFDKTGTLTYGKPQVTTIKSVDPSLSEEALLVFAASAESRSEHPLGKAIVAHFRNRSSHSLQNVEAFRMLIGRGVSARVDDRNVIAGNAVLMSENGVSIPDEIQTPVDVSVDAGGSVIYVALDGVLSGFLVMADQLRDDAVSAVGRMRDMGMKIVLLTGDRRRTAENIAKAVGIEDVYAECLPEEKLRIIREYQESGTAICMVGDGVNDAAALKRATVGIAMGGIGSDIAVDAADIVLVKDDVQNISHLLSLAKRTMKTINWNLGLSMLLNFAAIYLAITGVLNPVLGALVHNVGSVAVIINSSLLLGKKVDVRAADGEKTGDTQEQSLRKRALIWRLRTIRIRRPARPLSSAGGSGVDSRLRPMHPLVPYENPGASRHHPQNHAPPDAVQAERGEAEGIDQGHPQYVACDADDRGRQCPADAPECPGRGVFQHGEYLAEGQDSQI